MFPRVNTCLQTIEAFVCNKRTLEAKGKIRKTSFQQSKIDHFLVPTTVMLTLSKNVVKFRWDFQYIFPTTVV